MSLKLTFALSFAVLAMIAISKSAVIVPQGQAYVVERLGRYTQTLRAGFHVLVPFIDVVRHRHSLAEEALTLPAERCRTRDDREAWVESRATMKVLDPERASYATADYRTAVAQAAQTALRRAIADVDGDALSAGRTAASDAIARELAKAAEPWGVAVLRHEILDISRYRKE